MGDEERFDFTVPLINSNKIAFSYSGLKNQVRLKIEELKELSYQDRCDISASFQKTATAHLLHKLKKVFEKEDIKDFAIVGGASANLYLREKMQELCKKYNKNLHLAKLSYCSDNALMIGRCAIDGYKKNDFVNYKDLDIISKIK